MATVTPSSPFTRKRQVHILIGFLMWVLGLVAILSLGLLPRPDQAEAALCGPWGCLPPLPALVSAHAAWLWFLLPVTAMGLRCLSGWSRKWVALGMLGLSGLGLLMVAAEVWLVWVPEGGSAVAAYAWNRWGYLLAIRIDLPILELGLVGALSLFGRHL